ncbi:hypothetical protein WA026_000332 [Henosepilachna vigintioctopunctata]|uniref:Uncharacterized protein n=1 Tax=Henosepilachna vigintioctopunctata TaxID=420089 RepID=A0AAW1V050_9CUCU
MHLTKASSEHEPPQAQLQTAHFVVESDDINKEYEDKDGGAAGIAIYKVLCSIETSSQRFICVIPGVIAFYCGTLVGSYDWYSLILLEE